MEVGTVVSIGALLVSFVALILNSRKDTRADAAQNAITQTKLDSVKTGVDDIRVEIRSMRDSLSNHSERLAMLESKAESNSSRIDKLEERKSE